MASFAATDTLNIFFHLKTVCLNQVERVDFQQQYARAALNPTPQVLGAHPLRLEQRNDIGYMCNQLRFEC
jgi:hypothetical protein